MLKVILTAIMIMTSWQASACPTAEQPDRAVEKYNLEDGVGLKGFDPVAYFEEHGGQAIQGDTSISTEYGEVVYHFSSEKNREIFLANPTKYEPTYGGWCAWAMAHQAYADINPMLFTQSGNRMHFFISRGAKARFDQDLKKREKDADDFWTAETGEAPRL